MNNNSANILDIKNIEVTYDDVILALHDVSLKVPKGKVVALLGANGAGKSTTLKAVSTMLASERGKVTKGSIDYDGNSIQKQNPSQMVGLGMVQELEKIYGYFLRLKERRKSQAAFTSGGEQQMIAVARAMMAKPKMLLLDEPTMGLAPQLVAEIFNIVKELNQKEGVSILLAEQNTNIALKNSDYGYIIETGKVMLEGSAESLLNNDKVKELYLGISKKGRKNFRDVLKEESLNKRSN